LKKGKSVQQKTAAGGTLRCRKTAAWNPELLYEKVLRAEDGCVSTQNPGRQDFFQIWPYFVKVQGMD